jgi:hypothetical protein
MTAEWLERVGARIVTRRRARAVSVITLFCMTATYGFGVAHRRGLVDGFGHLIGGDLLEQRIAALMTRDGHGDELYNFELQAHYEQEAVAPEPLPGLNPFMSPPWAALFYWPLMLLRQGVAFIVWTAIGIAALVISVFWLEGQYAWIQEYRATVLLLSLSFFPVIEGLMAGSNQLISLLLLTGVFVSLKRGRDGLAGVLLGVQLFKPQLAVATLAVLVYKRRWRSLCYCGAVALTWVALATMFVARGSVAQYLEVIPALARLPLADGFPYYLLTSLHSLFIIPFGSRFWGWSNAIGTVASVAAVIALLRVWAGPWRPQSEDFERRVAATLVATPLVSQYFLLHDVTIMILATVLLADHAMRRGGRQGWGATRLALATLWVFCFVGPVITQRFRMPLLPWALVLVGWSIWVNQPSASSDPPKALIVRSA